MGRNTIGAAFAVALMASACGSDSAASNIDIEMAETTAVGQVETESADPTVRPATTPPPSMAVASTASLSTSTPSTTLAAPVMMVSSSAYSEGERIPVEFTCDGEGPQPAYTVSGLPSGTVSLAVVMDATVPQGVFTHWVQFNMPPEAEIPQDAIAVGTLGAGLFGNLGYAAPCPLGDALGSYATQFFAVDSFLGLDEGATKQELLDALQGRVIGTAELTGEYSRS